MNTTSSKSSTLATDGRLEVRYDLTVDDLRAVRKYAQTHDFDGRRKVPATRGTRALLMLIGAMVVIFSVFARLKRPAQPELNPMPQWSLQQFMPVIIATSIIGVLILLYKASVHSSIKKLGADPRLKNRRFVLKPDGYTASSELDSLDTYWSGVLRIAVTKTHLLFITAVRGEFIEAQVVPRRAFADDAHFEHLLQTVRRNYSGEVHDER